MPLTRTLLAKLGDLRCVVQGEYIGHFSDQPISFEQEESPEPAAKSVCDAEEEPAIPVSAPPNRRSTNVITLPNLMLLVGLPVIVYYSIVGYVFYLLVCL